MPSPGAVKWSPRPVTLPACLSKCPGMILSTLSSASLASTLSARLPASRTRANLVRLQERVTNHKSILDRQTFETKQQAPVVLWTPCPATWMPATFTDWLMRLLALSVKWRAVSSAPTTSSAARDWWISCRPRLRIPIRTATVPARTSSASSPVWF